MLAMLLLALQGGGVAAAPAGNACPEAVAGAQASLVARGALVEMERGSNGSPHNPHPGRDALVIRLGSTQAPLPVQRRSVAVLTDAAFQGAMTRDLFAACPQLVEVTFTIAETDEASTLFRGADGAVLRGICLEIGTSDAWPPWGELFCP